MYLNENTKDQCLPTYEVKELSMEEALLVLAAEKELFREMSIKSKRVADRRFSR